MVISSASGFGTSISLILLATAVSAQLLVSVPLLAADSKQTSETSPQVRKLWDTGWKFSKAGKHKDAVQQFKKATELAPNSADGWNRYYVELELAGNLKEAEKALRKAVELEPRNALYLTNLGVFLARNDERKQAVPFLERAVKLDPKSTEGWFTLGVLYAENRDIRAKMCLEKDLALEPNDSKAHSTLAYILHCIKKYEESEAHYRKAIELRRQNMEAWDGLITLLVARNRAKEASASLDDLAKVKPTKAKDCLDMSAVFLKRTRFDEAKRCLQQAQKTSRTMTVVDEVQMGQILRLMGKFDESEQCHRRALRQNPTSGFAMTELGLTLSQQKGKSAEAIKCLRIATHLNPENELGWIALTQTLYEAGELKDAEEAARQACKIHSTSADCLSSLAFMLLERGKSDEAKKYAELAIHAGPAGSFQALNNIGIIELYCGKYREAELFFKDAIAVDPSSAFAWQNLGLSLFRQGDKKGAILAAENSIRIRPTALAWRNLAYLRKSVNDKKGAAEALKNALALSGTVHSKYSLSMELEKLEGGQSSNIIKPKSGSKDDLGAGTLIPHKNKNKAR